MIIVILSNSFFSNIKKFFVCSPVIIEVPHFASLRGKEREIVILRSDNGETWREHTLEASEEAVQDVLNESFEGEGMTFKAISLYIKFLNTWKFLIICNGLYLFFLLELSQLEDLQTSRIVRILTVDFPHYFAVVSRIRQEVHAVGPEGGTVSSSAVPQVQAVFPQAALTKKIRVGLQVFFYFSSLIAINLFHMLLLTLTLIHLNIINYKFFLKSFKLLA